ncbi:hypothetical protein ABK040_008032 [Willaertia magna]
MISKPSSLLTAITPTITHNNNEQEQEQLTTIITLINNEEEEIEEETYDSYIFNNNKQEHGNNLSDLPFDCLLSIFDYLPLSFILHNCVHNLKDFLLQKQIFLYLKKRMLFYKIDKSFENHLIKQSIIYHWFKILNLHVNYNLFDWLNEIIVTNEEEFKLITKLFTNLEQIYSFKQFFNIVNEKIETLEELTLFVDISQRFNFSLLFDYNSLQDTLQNSLQNNLQNNNAITVDYFLQNFKEYLPLEIRWTYDLTQACPIDALALKNNENLFNDSCQSLFSTNFLQSNQKSNSLNDLINEQFSWIHHFIFVMSKKNNILFINENLKQKFLNLVFPKQCKTQVVEIYGFLFLNENSLKCEIYNITTNLSNHIPLIIKNNTIKLNNHLKLKDISEWKFLECYFSSYYGKSKYLINNNNNGGFNNTIKVQNTETLLKSSLFMETFLQLFYATCDDTTFYKLTVDKNCPTIKHFYHEHALELSSNNNCNNNNNNGNNDYTDNYNDNFNDNYTINNVNYNNYSNNNNFNNFNFWSQSFYWGFKQELIFNTKNKKQARATLLPAETKRILKKNRLSFFLVFIWLIWLFFSIFFTNYLTFPITRKLTGENWKLCLQYIFLDSITMISLFSSLSYSFLISTATNGFCYSFLIYLMKSLISFYYGHFYEHHLCYIEIVNNLGFLGYTLCALSSFYEIYDIAKCYFSANYKLFDSLPKKSVIP